jgi:hypothetical protein
MKCSYVRRYHPPLVITGGGVLSWLLIGSRVVPWDCTWFIAPGILVGEKKKKKLEFYLLYHQHNLFFFFFLFPLEFKQLYNKQCYLISRLYYYYIILLIYLILFSVFDNRFSFGYYTDADRCQIGGVMTLINAMVINRRSKSKQRKRFVVIKSEL